MATPMGRSSWTTLMLPACAASTSGRRLYIWGASSVPAPRNSTPVRRSQSSIISRVTSPPGRVRARHHPAGAVDGAAQGQVVLGRIDALDNHRDVAHRTADDRPLTRLI